MVKVTVAGDAERCFVGVTAGAILMEFIVLRRRPWKVVGDLSKLSKKDKR